MLSTPYGQCPFKHVENFRGASRTPDAVLFGEQTDGQANSRRGCSNGKILPSLVAHAQKAVVASHPGRCKSFSAESETDPAVNLNLKQRTDGSF